MHVSRERVLMPYLAGGRRPQERLTRRTDAREPTPLAIDRLCSCLQWEKLDDLVLA